METVDYDLLGLPDGDTDVPEVPEISEPGEVVAEVVDEPIVEVVADPVAVVVDEPNEEEFEDRPLTPRERTLIERLERVTGEQLNEGSEPPPANELPPVSSSENIDFLEGLDLDEVFSTPEGVNQLLMSVYNRGLEQSSKLAAENIMRNLPQVISQYVTQHIGMNERVNQFYEANPELKTVRKTVAAVANEIAAESPELELDEVFNQSADRVYKMLGLKKGNATTKPPAASKSALVAPRGSNNRVKVPELQGLEAEITDLLEL